MIVLNNSNNCSDETASCKTQREQRYFIMCTNAPEARNDEDPLTKAIGDFGRWQTVLILAIAWPVKISSTWIQMGIIFLAPKTTFTCLHRNSSQSITNSTCYGDCVKYEYYSEFDNTLISQWDLICDRAWLASFTQTMCMFGVLVGSILFGFIADRHGRRPALLMSCLLQLSASLVAPFCSDYWTFATVRFFLGSATAGTMLTSFILLVEVTGLCRRELINFLLAFPVPLGEMLMPIFANYLRTWDKFCLGIAVPNLLFLTYIFIMPESPKWLVSVGRVDKASEIITKAANCNNLPTENMMDVAKRMANAANVDSDKLEVKATYLDLIRLPSLRLKNLLSCTSWFILGLSFYGSNQYIGQTSTSVYVTIALAGALQIPGLILGACLCQHYGRRMTLICLLTICAVSNGLLAIPDEWFYVKLVFGSVGVSSASGAFACMYMYTSELFPTVTRNMAMGASSMSSRVGSMLAPFIAGLTFAGGWVPPAIFATAPLIAATACYCLPETKDKKLTDHLDE